MPALLKFLFVASAVWVSEARLRLREEVVPPVLARPHVAAARLLLPKCPLTDDGWTQGPTANTTATSFAAAGHTNASADAGPLAARLRGRQQAHYGKQAQEKARATSLGSADVQAVLDEERQRAEEALAAEQASASEEEDEESEEDGDADDDEEASGEADDDSDEVDDGLTPSGLPERTYDRSWTKDVNRRLREAREARKRDARRQRMRAEAELRRKAGVKMRNAPRAKPAETIRTDSSSSAANISTAGTVKAVVVEEHTKASGKMTPFQRRMRDLSEDFKDMQEDLDRGGNGHVPSSDDSGSPARPEAMPIQEAPATAAAPAPAQPVAYNSEPRVFFLFLLQNGMAEPDIWRSFFAAADGAKYRSFVHCSNPEACKASGLFWKVPGLTEVSTVPSYYCHDLVTAMVHLLSAATAASAVEGGGSSRDKFVFVSDSTLPLKPFAEMHTVLTGNHDSDICVFPSNHWATAYVGDKKAHLVKHHQWVTLSREHAQVMVRDWKEVDSQGHWAVPIDSSNWNGDYNASSFQREPIANWCTDEWAFFATLFGAIVDEGYDTAVSLRGFGTGRIEMHGPASKTMQGVCRTFAFFNEDGVEFANLGRAVAQDAGSKLSCWPSCQARPATIQALTETSVLTLRRSPFMFARKFESGVMSLAHFERYILPAVPPEVHQWNSPSAAPYKASETAAVHDGDVGPLMLHNRGGAVVGGRSHDIQETTANSTGEKDVAADEADEADEDEADEADEGEAAEEAEESVDVDDEGAGDAAGKGAEVEAADADTRQADEVAALEARRLELQRQLDERHAEEQADASENAPAPAIANAGPSATSEEESTEGVSGAGAPADVGDDPTQDALGASGAIDAMSG